MEDSSVQAEAMKTCFGILAIMSREESNKMLIARDGIETILNAMTSHVDKTDVQESGCDLLWSLAFNNAAIKVLRPPRLVHHPLLLLPRVKNSHSSFHIHSNQ